MDTGSTSAKREWSVINAGNVRDVRMEGDVPDGETLDLNVHPPPNN